MKPKHFYDPWRRQHDVELDGCYGGMYRTIDCDGAICRHSCTLLKRHRYTMRDQKR